MSLASICRLHMLCRLSKAFDSVWRVGLWHIMRYLGYEEKIVRLLEALYQGTECAVRVDGGLADWFETMVGVFQGCILSPLLFNLLLEVVVALALHGCGVGASISGINIPELRFVDDMSLLAESEHDLQDLVDHLDAADLVLKSATLKLKYSVLARMSQK